jgi:hypothetical protein
MTKRDRALELRDLALAALRARGRPARVNEGSIQALTFDDDGLSVLHTTPFQRLPHPTGVLKYLAALHGLDPPENLPYGLDVWRGGKKLNIEWSDSGQVVVVSYKAGDWERELERHAAQVGVYATSNHRRSA